MLGASIRLFLVVTNIFLFRYSQDVSNDLNVIRWDIQRSTNNIYWETIITNASPTTNYWFETNNVRAFYRVVGIK